ncbi:MAG: T9SS type A sorting domain-containing protein, partial [Bacteroidales bacterium]
INNITASATPSNICLGQTTTLQAGNGSNFLWAGLGLGVNKVVNPIVNTTYYVSGTDMNGCSGGTASIPVNVIAAPTIAITGDNTIAPGGTATLTAEGAGDDGVYNWSTGATNVNYIQVSPNTTTTYTVQGTTSGGCSGTASYSVSVATVNAGPNQFICAGSPVTLTATSSGIETPVYVWTWSTGNGSQPGSNYSVTPGPSETTVYTVTVNGLYTDQVTVFVNPKPNAIAPASVTIASGTSTTLMGGASGGTAPYTYIWTGPTGTATGNPLTTPNLTANTTFSLEVKDAFQCQSTNAATTLVTVASATGLTVTGDIAYAFGTVNKWMHDVQIKLIGTAGEGTFTGTSASNGNGNFSIPGVTPGTYKVCLNSPKPWGGVTCADVTAIQNTYRARNPIALNGIKRLASDVIDPSACPVTNVADRNLVELRRVTPATAFPATGDWVFMKETEISNAGCDFNYTNSYGYAGGTSSIIISVSAGSLSHNFRALCYGDVDASYTGLKDAEIAQIYDGTEEDWLQLSNYPNPFSNQTTISYYQPVAGHVSIEVFDMMGKMVKTIKSVNSLEGDHTVIMDGSTMAPGIYICILTLKTSDGIIRQTTKLIVTK